jgi:hypothetical protein
MSLKCLLSLAFILCLAFTAGTAKADSITVQNPSFELTNPLIGSCGTGCAWNNGPIPGWTISPDVYAGTFEPTSDIFALPLPDGSLVAWANGGSISQTLTGVSLLPNSTYTLTVYVGQRIGYPTDYSIALGAGSTQLAVLSGPTVAGAFQLETLTYTTGSSVTSGDLYIALSSAGVQTGFDDVSLTVVDPPAVPTDPVPEPASMTLLGSGLALLAARLRARRS